MVRRIASVLSVGLLSALSLAACERTASDTPEAPAAADTAAAPAVPAATEAADPVTADPVAAVIERAELCLHFGGEEPFDDARRAQINQAFEDNRCDTVVADGDALIAERPQDAARIEAALEPLRP